jgi:hypothetical protein
MSLKLLVYEALRHCSCHILEGAIPVSVPFVDVCHVFAAFVSAGRAATH